MSCTVLFMILMIAMYLCPKQLKIGAKCCSRINCVKAAMYVSQRITVQENLNSENHVRKNIQLAYIDSKLRRKG